MKVKMMIISMLWMFLVLCPQAFSQSDTTANPLQKNQQELSLQDSVRIIDTSHLPYVCPMHPEIKSAQAGTCPKCGMQLVKKENGPKSEKMGMMGMGGTTMAIMLGMMTIMMLTLFIRH